MKIKIIIFISILFISACGQEKYKERKQVECNADLNTRCRISPEWEIQKDCPLLPCPEEDECWNMVRRLCTQRVKK